MDSYTPKIIEKFKCFEKKAYVEMLLELSFCSICKNIMININKDNIFPNYYKLQLKEQLKKINGQIQSNIKDKKTDSYICKSCKEKGKLTFICSICNKEHLTNNIQEEIYGDPPEYVCKTCYSTLSAKQWNTEIKELEDKHKWDFTP